MVFNVFVNWLQLYSLLRSGYMDVGYMPVLFLKENTQVVLWLISSNRPHLSYPPPPKKNYLMFFSIGSGCFMAYKQQQTPPTLTPPPPKNLKLKIFELKIN